MRRGAAHPIDKIVYSYDFCHIIWESKMLPMMFILSISMVSRFPAIIFPSAFLPSPDSFPFRKATWHRVTACLFTGSDIVLFDTMAR